MNKINLSMIELFSGIGAQQRGFEQTELFNIESIGTSDLDKEVICSYAAIHCRMTNEMIENYEYPSKEEMIETLTKKRIGYDFKKDKPYDWAKLARKKDKTKGIEKYWLADKLSKNFGDITQIQSLPSTDILTYSAPCTDWSVAGQQEGGDWTCRECGFKYSPYDYKLEDRYSCPKCLSENIKSTRSGLLFEVERLLADLVEREEAPKYLFCENVDALVSKKFKPAFNAWVSRLEELGYNTYYDCVNAKFCGVPQNRNRLFAISVRKDIDTGKFEFPKPYDSGLRLKDLLETDYEVIEKYFLSDEVQQRLQITDPEFVKSIVGTTKPEFRTIGQRDLVYQKDSIMGALVATDYKQPKQILEDTNAPNRLFNIYGRDKGTSFAGNVYDEENICPTINTCQGGNRQPLLCADNEEKKMRLVRKLTPKEAHRLMGFRDEDYDKCKAIGMSDTQGYCQAGNSIVTDVVSLLAQHIYKAQYDNTYECLDETFNNRNESDTNKIMIVGNYMPSNHDASRVVDEEGIAPCVKENHGTVTGVLSRNFINPKVE